MKRVPAAPFIALLCQLVKCQHYQFLYKLLVVGFGPLVVAVGYDAAYGAAAVAEFVGHAGKGRAFHLKVGDPVVPEAELLKFFHHVRHCQRDTQNPSLRAVEAGSGDGYSFYGYICKKVYKFLRIPYKVRCREVFVPSCFCHKGLFHFLV